MKIILSLVAVSMLTFQAASAQLMGNLYVPHPTGAHFDISKYEGDGFRAEYYNGSNFEHKVLTRVDKTIDFFLYNRSPAEGINAEYFSIRWSGQLYVPQTGRYTFIFVADDAVRLWVNNKLIIDRWYLNRATAFTGDIVLIGKQLCNIKIEYSQMKPTAAVARASWSFEEEPEEPINPKYLFSSPAKIVMVAPKTKPVPSSLKKTSPAKVASNPIVKNTLPEQKKATPKLTAAPVAVKKKQPVAEKKETSKPEEKVMAPTISEAKEVVPTETFENLEAGKSVVLNHIFFDQSKHELRHESYEELDKLVNTLQKYPNMKIAITGHTDNVGDFNLNVQLSRERAKAVSEYLVARGIAIERVTHKGFGGLYPVSPNTTEDSKKKNRRVEFAVL